MVALFAGGLLAIMASAVGIVMAIAIVAGSLAATAFLIVAINLLIE
jgi:hypothetical protein